MTGNSGANSKSKSNSGVEESHLNGGVNDVAELVKIPSGVPVIPVELQGQIQPLLHNSLLQSSIGEHRNNDDSSVHLNPDGKTLESSTMSREKSITTRQNENFRNYLLKKLDSSTAVDCREGSQFLDGLSSSGLKSVKSHLQLAKTAQGVRILAKNLSKATIKLHLKSVMIVTKARDNSLIYLTRELLEWIIQKNEIDVYVDHHLLNSSRFNLLGLLKEYPQGKRRLKYWSKELVNKNPDLFDLALTLGGDGTVLYVSTLFQKVVPPVMSFSLGSLGFLTNFKFENFRALLHQVLRKGVKTNLRMRLTCRVHKLRGDLVCEQQVLNEIVIDRGPSPWVSMLELYGDGNLLTVAQADGLILLTPTGSTAYSLSAGGSLVHPGVSAISVTPICPHTLSFRPILLPDSMTLSIKVPLRSRSNAWCSFDGRSRIELQKGDYVTVVLSPFPFPTVRSSKTEFIDSVSRILNWNVREEQKSFVHLLSDKNKLLFDKHNSEKQSKRGSRTAMFDMCDAEDTSDNDDIDSVDSMDFHQLYFDDNDQFNGGSGQDVATDAAMDPEDADGAFDIDYSDSEKEEEPETLELRPVSVHHGSKLKNQVTDSSSTLEMDDEMPLLDQVRANRSLEASQIITGELLDNLNRLSTNE